MANAPERQFCTIHFRNLDDGFCPQCVQENEHLNIYTMRSPDFHGNGSGARPDNHHMYSPIELGAIWELEIPDDAPAAQYAKDILIHKAIAAQPLENIWHPNGIDDKRAADMMTDAALSEIMNNEPEEPLAWPCVLDHSVTHEELEAEGWIHGDPDEYIENNDNEADGA